MKKETIMTGIIGLLIGIIITGFTVTSAVNNQNTSLMDMMGVDTAKIQYKPSTNDSSISMGDMNSQLETKSGDDFDKTFTEMMIIHHQGAIDMANLASTRATHQEIKDLSKDIISAQQKEIAEMQKWQMDWSYKTTNDTMPGMMH